MARVCWHNVLSNQSCSMCRGSPQRLVRHQRAKVIVQPCDRRIFANGEYERAGAAISDDLEEANAIFGVKQVPVGQLLPRRAYMFFSHVIKAQPENMGLLDEIRARHIRLFDYE